METIGLGIGIAGLAGVFTACVDCFEYVQLGRQFGRDYGKCLLKLDAAKVRMSRWGAAIGLGPELYNKQRISASIEEIRLAQSLLEQILDSFKDAERISERFQKRTSTQNPTSTELTMYDADTDLALDYQRLHLTMRELARQRQKQTSVRKIVVWAIYEKKSFDRMIDDVSGFVRELVDLFPAAQEPQRALCKAEVSAIVETRDLLLLNDITSQDDKILAAEVEKEMNSRGHTVSDWKAGGSSKMWAGDENAPGVKSKSHNFSRFEVSGSADVHLGNKNRG
ncbi:MAG: hypothetical protein Q9190_004210 [Brigantiaea leucoxantha]